jgi:predicted transcriptional regulator
MKTISFRTKSDRVEELDALAATQQRDRTFIINEALDNYLALQHSHREQILAGIAAGEAGQLIPHDEVVRRLEERRRAE